MMTFNVSLGCERNAYKTKNVCLKSACYIHCYYGQESETHTVNATK